MTIDELLKIFEQACVEWGGGDANYSDHSARWFGVRAVANAILREHHEMMAKEILASDDVKGTHGSPELDEDARKLEAMGQDAGMTLQDLDLDAYITTPAAAPVCEWRIKEYCWETSCGRKPINTPPAGYLNCSCGKPISFKSEAAR